MSEINLYELMEAVDQAVERRKAAEDGSEFARARGAEKLARDKLQEATLKQAGRDKLKPSQFAMPRQRKYPIHDKTHAASALAYAKQHGDLDTVKPKVCKKYPDLPACQDDS